MPDTSDQHQAEVSLRALSNEGRRGWSAIREEHHDFARDCVRIFKEELALHMTAYPKDFDRREHRRALEVRMESEIAAYTGRTTRVIQCVLRDRQRPEDPPNALDLEFVWDDDLAVEIVINDQM